MSVVVQGSCNARFASAVGAYQKTNLSALDEIDRCSIKTLYTKLRRHYYLIGSGVECPVNPMATAGKHYGCRNHMVPVVTKHSLCGA
jgi:hypothetical protein